MIARIVSCVSSQAEFATLETVVVFDTCLSCGSMRKRNHGGYVCDIEGDKSEQVHLVSCDCGGHTPHVILDEEFMIIRMLNELDCIPEVNIVP